MLIVWDSAIIARKLSEINLPSWMLQDSPLQTVSFFRGPLVVVRNKTLIWGWLLGGPLKPSFEAEFPAGSCPSRWFDLEATPSIWAKPSSWHQHPPWMSSLDFGREESWLAMVWQWGNQQSRWRKDEPRKAAATFGEKKSGGGLVNFLVIYNLLGHLCTRFSYR